MMSNNQMVSPNMLGEKLVQNSSNPNPNTTLNNNHNYSYGNPFASYGSNTYTTDQTNHHGDSNTQQPSLPTQGNLDSLNNRIADLGFEKLLRVQGLYLKRKSQKCCRKFSHRHAFYPLDLEGRYQRGTKLFRSTEEVPCCRWTFGPHNASITSYDKDNSEINGLSFLAFEKVNECNCKNSHDPTNIFLTTGDKKTFIGSVLIVSQNGTGIFHVKDKNEELHFIVTFCASTNKCCELAKLDIMTPDETKVGEIKSQNLNCMHSKVAYSIVFPERADGLERALLIGVLMAVERIDFEVRNSY